MPYSMTGFAAADIAIAPFRLDWQLRSVNHRFLDLSFRLPEEFRRLEPEYRDFVAQSVRRGKLDCTLKVSLSAIGPTDLEIDAQVLTGLSRLQESLQSEFPDAQPLTVAELLRWPGALKEPEQQLSTLAEPAMLCLKEALQAFQQARRREGVRIAEFLEQRNASILSVLSDVRPLLDGAQDRYREKLEGRLSKLDLQAEPGRVEQELVLIAQRLDVAEEIDRLQSHVTEVRDVLERDEPIGRRLDFLVQELNREANTLSSKVQDEKLTRSAIELKVLIEQLREQIQNLE